MPALPFTGEVQRRSAGEDFLHLAAPAALHEVIRRGDATAQELLQLVALQLGGRAEGAQELARHGFGVDWRRFRALVGILVDQLIDTDQSFAHGDGAAFVHIHLAVVTREVFQRLAAPDDLKVGGGQTFLRVIFQHGLQLAHVGHHLAAHAAPAHRLGFFGAFAADMDDVVLDGLGAELAFALGFVGADGIRRFEVVARIEQRLQHRDPRLVLAVMEGEG